MNMCFCLALANVCVLFLRELFCPVLVNMVTFVSGKLFKSVKNVHLEPKQSSSLSDWVDVELQVRGVFVTPHPQWQEMKEANPDIASSGPPRVFPGQMGCMILPVGSGSTTGS